MCTIGPRTVAHVKCMIPCGHHKQLFSFKRIQMDADYLLINSAMLVRFHQI